MGIENSCHLSFSRLADFGMGQLVCGGLLMHCIFAAITLKDQS
jgi:hypothetical protein